MKLNTIKTKNYLGHKLGKNLSGQAIDQTIFSFLSGIRKKNCIFNEKYISEGFLKGLYFLSLIKKKKGHILIVNTNPEFSKLIKNFLNYTDKQNSNKSTDHLFSFCDSKWVGGTLTNWKQIQRSIIVFSKFSEKYGKFIERNNIHFPKYKKMKKSFQGLQKKKNGFLSIKKPDTLFIINPNENLHVIAEANNLSIPVIALIDSNSNIKGIDYPIPGNNNSINFIFFCFSWIARILK